MRNKVFILFALSGIALAADPITEVVSLPHSEPPTAFAPDLIQGLSGIGRYNGLGLPCINCYGTSGGIMLLPPPLQLIDVITEQGAILYCTVETGNVGGMGTSKFDVVEATTGKVFYESSSQVMLQPNSTNLIAWDTGGIGDHDGYTGAEIVVFTTTLGTSTVQGKAYLWMKF